MVQGAFLHQLKLSFVRPVPKLLPPKSIENDLRPISLASQISKVMKGFTEKALLSQVLYKLDTKQFVLPKKSTTHALVNLLHSILTGLDKGHCSARVFFADFKKGFDLVDRNAIVQKLQNLQVYPAIIRWINTFLLDREQYVRTGKGKSSWKRRNGWSTSRRKTLSPLVHNFD